MEKSIFYIIFILLTQILQAQQVIQINAEDTGSAPEIELSDFDINQVGSKIVVGGLRHQGVHDFDPSPDGIVELSANTPFTTGFVASYNRSGKLNFAFHISDEDITPRVFNYFIESDAENNIYIVGDFWGKADFDPSEEVFELRAENFSTPNSFLASYTQTGELRFAISFPSFYFQIFTSISLSTRSIGKLLTVDAFGNSFFLFPALVRTSFVDNSDSEITLEEGFYVLSFNSAGEYRFANKVPSFKIIDIGGNKNGDFFITGFNEKNFDFDPSEKTFILEDNDDSSFFFAAYSADGSFKFAKNLKGMPAVPNVITSNSSGDIFLAGKISGKVDFDPSENVLDVEVSMFEPDIWGGDIFIARYSASGEILMAKAIEDKVGQQSTELLTDMEVDENNNIWITGKFSRGVVDFDPSADKFELNGGIKDNTADDGFDLFWASYNSEGNLNFAYSIPDARTILSSLEIDPHCSTYTLAGTLRSNVNFDFDPSNDVLEVKTGDDSEPIYLVSLIPENVEPLDNCDFSTSIISANSISESLIEIGPNPFNYVTNISYSIKEKQSIQVVLYDISGLEIKTIFKGIQSAGTYSLEINSSSLSNGVYFCSLKMNNQFITKKIIKL